MILETPNGFVAMPGRPEPARHWQSGLAFSGWIAVETGGGPLNGGSRVPSLPTEDQGFEQGRRNLLVLLAEDNPADVRLVRESLEHHGYTAEIVVQQDGEAMLEYLRLVEAGEVPCPDLILLDLNLPRKSGHMVLESLRGSKTCGQVPVIVVTSSNASKDRELAARFGASSYFRKPIDYDEFLLLGALVKHILAKEKPD